MGVDGSGKSTMIRHLPGSLSNLKVHATRLDSNVFFSRHFALSSYLITRLYRILILLCQTFRLRPLKGFACLLTPIKSELTFLNTKAKLRHIKNNANNGHLVLVDRWCGSIRIKRLKAFGAHKPELFARYLTLWQPSIIFLMTVPQEISKQRRPEET